MPPLTRAAKLFSINKAAPLISDCTHPWVNFLHPQEKIKVWSVKPTFMGHLGHEAGIPTLSCISNTQWSYFPVTELLRPQSTKSKGQRRLVSSDHHQHLALTAELSAASPLSPSLFFPFFINKQTNKVTFHSCILKNKETNTKDTVSSNTRSFKWSRSAMWAIISFSTPQQPHRLGQPSGHLKSETKHRTSVILNSFLCTY